jgi:thioesterase domain-containing protein
MIAPSLEKIGSVAPPSLPGIAGPALLADAEGVSMPSDEEGEDVFVFPATAAQRRFWLLDQLVPGGNSALNMPLAARLTGRLDREALTRALNEIVRRHEILRTSFQCERGQLRQIIAPALTLPVPLVDVRDFPAAERERLPEHLLGEEAQRPFDLARGPAMRAQLVRIATDEHLLLITVHHIVTDGWSNGVLVRELAELYTAYVRGQPSPLPELPIQFADFCQWQEEHVAEAVSDAQMAYWREMLAGELPVLELPIDRPRRSSRGQALLGGVRQEVIPPALPPALKALAVRGGVSTYMLYLAAFTVLLSRYSGGQEDILVNTPSANRDRREVEPLIGPFVNPLLLRTDLSGDPTFSQLLGRVREVALGAFEHAAMPFEKVLEELPPRRLQASFLLQSNSPWPARIHDLAVAPLTVTSGAVLAEWSAAVSDDGAQTRFMIVYNADLYDAATIDRVLASYRRLLESIAAPGGMDTAISQLPLEPAAEQIEPSVLLAHRWRLPAESAGWMDVCFQADAAPGQAEFGRARAGIEVLVLDGHLQPALIGVAGEIYLRGLSDADRQSLAAAGLELPPAGSMFRTGDLARRRPDGRIEWLGRANEQVHVHGLRVDTGAIEAALRTHPHIREAVVLWQGRIGGDRRLTAFVQSDGAAPALFGHGHLRDFLRESLPEEWIPADFVPVDRFPSTADGRLDAAALPDLATRSAPAHDAKDDAPFLTIHYQLIDLWQQLLSVPAVGIHDDFFALGGNSLLAMRMLYRIEQIFGKALLPVTLFKQPTIEHLAAEMLKHEEGQPAPAVVKLNDQGSKTPIFYLHGDFHGGGFYAMKLARHLGPDQPFYSLPPTELTDPGNPPTVQEMAARQVHCIREVRPHGPYVIGGFCLGGLISYEVAQQLAAAGEVVERLLVIDAILKNPRLRRLRRAAEVFGRLRGLTADRRLFLFCNWHFLLARLQRWRRMPLREQAAIVTRRLAGLRQSVIRRLRRGRPQPPGNAPVEKLTEQQPKEEWFDPRWDVPLVYLWSAGDYLPAPYTGATTVLLSRDLFQDRQRRGLQNWQRYLAKFDVRELPGSHLACITEHVDALAETIERCLEPVS